MTGKPREAIAEEDDPMLKLNNCSGTDPAHLVILRVSVSEVKWQYCYGEESWRATFLVG